MQLKLVNHIHLFNPWKINLNFIYIVLSLGSNSSLSGFGAFEFQNHVFWANSVSIAL
jgi:hypothetical protein